MVKHHQSPITHFLQSIKTYVEANSGISLSDAVNVSLFLLTIVSLLLAAIGVLIAWVTYQGAESSGATQMIALQSAANSLSTANKSLQDTTTKLAALNDQIGKSIGIQTQEQTSLNSAVALSSQQLKLIQKQTTLAERIPNVRLEFECGPQAGAGEEDLHLIFGPNGFRRDLSSTPQRLRTFSREYAMCYLKLANLGQAKLRNAYVRIYVNVTDMKADAIWDPIMIRVEDAHAVPWSKGEWIQERPAEEISVISGQDVFPSAPESSEYRSRFYVRLAEPVQQIVISGSFGGDEQRPESFDFKTKIDHAE